MRHETFAILTATLAFSWSVCVNDRTRQDPPDLFSPVDSGVVPERLSLRANAAQFLVQPTSAFFSERPLETGDEFMIRVAPDRREAVNLDRVENLSPGSRVIYGSIGGQVSGSIALSQLDSVVVGFAQIGDAVFSFEHLGAGLHHVQERSYQELPEELPPQPDPGPRPFGVHLDRCEVEETTDTVDVLVVLTQELVDSVRGWKAAVAWVNLAVGRANIALKASRARVQFRLNDALQVNYRESGSLQYHLKNLTHGNDGLLEIVPSRRKESKSDLVSLWIRNADHCGYGQLNLDPGFKPERAFSVVRWDCAWMKYSFAHELGHNFGLGHDTGDAEVTGLFAYSHGFVDPDGKFRTIMGGLCPGGKECEPWGRIGLFSHPGREVDGRPAGDSLRADAARSLNAVGCKVARWF